MGGFGWLSLVLAGCMFYNLILVLLLISLGRRFIDFLSKFESGNKELKYCCEVGMLVFIEINIEYNSFEANFSKLRRKLFLIK